MRKSSEIKALRKRMGLTRAGFALAVGCTPTTVKNWESGRTVQPRYRDRLDSVASRVAVDARSVIASAGEPVSVLVVESGDRYAYFCAGRKPLIGESVFGQLHNRAVDAWLGAGVKYTLTFAEVTSGELAANY